MSISKLEKRPAMANINLEICTVKIHRAFACTFHARGCCTGWAEQHESSAEIFLKGIYARYCILKIFMIKPLTDNIKKPVTTLNM